MHTPQTVLSYEDLLEAWSLLSPEERIEGFRLLAPEDADDFFLSLNARDQAELLLALPTGERRLWLRLLAPDDAADVMQELPLEEREKFLTLLDENTHTEVIALFSYAEDEAGGLMNPRYARVRPEMSVDEALSYLRRQARERLETIYYAYVLDAQQHLLGVASFRELFVAPREKTVREVMQTDVVTVSEQMGQEAVSQTTP